MVLVATVGLMFVAALMLGGWGWAFHRVLKLERANWPVMIAVGMAVIVFLGGILNLARLAYPSALAMVVIGGILLGFAAIRDQRPERPSILVSLLIAAIVIFTILTQLPPGVYNFHDDFQKYFAYSERMLQTGTVFGSPLSAIGQQTLGAQAFLDGFVMAFLPIVYVNAVDAVFGLLLCLMIASQFAKGQAMTLLTVFSVFAINPEYVNISTLYCGSALIMTIAGDCSPSAVGLLYAALVAMKPTFGVFVALHFLALTLASGWRWAIRAGVAGALFLSPWILVHLPHYLEAIRHPRLPPPHVEGPIEPDPIHIFSNAPLDFGDAALHYTLLLAAVGICGLICYRTPRMLAYCMAGVATYLAFCYVLSPLHAGFHHSMRYFCPIAIGIAPVAFGWVSGAARRPWIPLLLTAIPVLLFLPTLKTRIGWAVHTHSVASFDWLAHEPAYVAYSHRVLTEKQRLLVKTLQEKIPAGEPILTWTNDPFYLDYRRNRIIDIDQAGLGLPWANMPEARYIILDYEGYPTPYEGNYREDALDVGAGERRNAEYSLDFLHRINNLIAHGQVLYDTGEVKVVRLPDL